MRSLRKFILFYPLIVLFFISAGCASVLLAGAGGGIGYTLTNVAYKTVSYPIGEVETAVRSALKRMAIREIQKEETDKGFRITAETADLKIRIDLEHITKNATQISVDAQKNLILKDRATAAEIIEQTERILTHS